MNEQNNSYDPNNSEGIHLNEPLTLEEMISHIGRCDDLSHRESDIQKVHILMANLSEQERAAWTQSLQDALAPREAKTDVLIDTAAKRRR